LEFLPVTPEIAQQAGELRRGWQKKVTLFLLLT
jgi:hypothetical protein